MVEIVKYILFRFALLIIALHAIIPHPHSEELTEKEHFELHKKANSLFGIIKITLHESDDENLDNLVFTRAENAKKTDVSYTYTSACIIVSAALGTGKIKAEKIVKWETNNLDNLLFVKLNGLRGPPTSPQSI